MSLFSRTTTDDERREREAIRSRIHRVACHACGTTAGVADTVTTRTALNGDRIEFGACKSCTANDLDRTVAARLLDLDAADLALDDISLTRYADLLPTPIGPAAEAWAHIDRSALAGDVMTARDRIAARTGGPCSACGLSILPEDSDHGWKGGHGGTLCPSCVWVFGDGASPERRRAIVAARLGGLSTPTRTPLYKVLVPFVTFWSDLPAEDRQPGGQHPWKHLDVRALRDEIARLADDGAVRLPVRWSERRYDRAEW